MASPYEKVAGIVRVTQPVVEPITLDQAKNYLRVDIADDDALITRLIVAAREACEAFIHGYLITQTVRVSYDAFPDDMAPIWIPAEPLQSITSVKWFDQTNTATTLNAWSAGTGDYILDTDHEPARLVLPPSTNWPGSALWPVSPVQVTAVVGFGADGSTVKSSYIDGMLLCIGHGYENREAVETSGAVGKEIPMSAEWSWWNGGRYWHTM